MTLFSSEVIWCHSLHSIRNNALLLNLKLTIYVINVGHQSKLVCLLVHWKFLVWIFPY